jgi:hypothetical protein
MGSRAIFRHRAYLRTLVTQSAFIAQAEKG